MYSFFAAWLQQRSGLSPVTPSLQAQCSGAAGKPVDIPLLGLVAG